MCGGAARCQPPWPWRAGIGIDAWCCLEFHKVGRSAVHAWVRTLGCGAACSRPHLCPQMRERYPMLFRSQLGNRIWWVQASAR